MSNHPCMPSINPSFSWCIMFLCIIKFGFQIFCWGILYLYSSRILAYNFLFLQCPCLVLVSGSSLPHKMHFEVFPPLPFFKESYGRIGIILYWNAWYNSSVKQPGPGFFIVGRYLIIDLFSLLEIGLFRFSILHGSILVGCMFWGI